MPFVRHELGKRLRLRRIPEFSVRLDESIERGSRVMQLLNEIEAGAQPDELPPGESLPTPIARMPHADDALPDIPPASPPAEGPQAIRQATAGHARRPADDDAGVGRGPAAPGRSRPDEVVERIRGARRILSISHENPDADTLGASLAVVCLGEQLGATCHARLRRCRRRRSTTSCRASSGSGRIRRRASSTTCWSSPTAARWSEPARCWSGTGPAPWPAAGHDRPPRLQRRNRAGRLDRPGRCGHLRDDGAARRRGSASRSTSADGALATNLMAGIVMDTATFAHPNSTPRTLVVAAALLEAGAPAGRDLAALLPDQADDPAAALRADPHPPRSRSLEGACIWSVAVRRGPAGHRCRPEPIRRASST